jgi:hypothetical protein
MSPTALLRSVTLFVLTHKAWSASTFTPNCTLPPNNTNYVSGPNTRGTLSILWNCLSIIILCTWNIQHLNIPAGRPITQNKWKALWWQILNSRRQLKWMIFTIFVPEYILGKALNERLAAQEARDTMNTSSLGEKGQTFELIHGYFANMGGYYLDFTDHFNKAGMEPREQLPANVPTNYTANGVDQVCPLEEDSVSGPTINPSIKDTLQKKPSDSMAEYMSQMTLEDDYIGWSRINHSRLLHECWTLNFMQLSITHSFGLFQSLPIVSSRDIEALDDSNVLIKFLAVAQVSWLIIQLILRKVRTLPSSQLEIAALAFSVSSLITYIVLWDRPRGINRRYRIKAEKLPDRFDVQSIVIYGPEYLWSRYRGKDRVDGEYNLVAIPDDAIHMSRSLHSVEDQLIVQIGAILGGIIFGSLHCLAWNFSFPTPLESLLWRICSVLTTALPCLAVLPSYYWSETNSYNLRVGEHRHIIAIVLLPLIIAYILARLFLIVETFRSLFYLPPEAFKETWSGSFPHWG